MSQPIVCDMFPFSEELDILDIRLNELNDVVDYFCIVESAHTQSRLPKPFIFEQNQARFSKFLHKIVYVKMDKLVGGVAWEAEFEQRRCLLECLNALIARGVKVGRDDFFILSDVDEIPRADIVKKHISKGQDLVVFNHYFNSYFLNWHSNFRAPWGWYGSILGKIGSLEYIDIQWLRTNKDGLNKTGTTGDGWHFSNMLINGFDSLYNKWVTRIEPTDKSHIEGEANKERLREIFNKHILEDKYFLFCDNPSNRSIKMEELDINLLPKYVINNRDLFGGLIKPNGGALKTR
jgi:hypothetical protein